MWTRCKGCCSKPPGSPGPPRSHDSCGWTLGQAAGRKQVCSCSAETAMRSTAIPPFCTSAAGSSTQPAALPPQSAAAATGLRLPSLTGRLGPCSPITSASAAGGGATHLLAVSDGFSSPLTSLVYSVCTGDATSVCFVSLLLTRFLPVFFRPVFPTAPPKTARYRYTSREGRLAQPGTHRNSVQKLTSSWRVARRFLDGMRTGAPEHLAAAPWLPHCRIPQRRCSLSWLFARQIPPHPPQR